ncbi:hypothetical protein T05_7464 [Trichinella murrelli]|uniref:Uncharacterized protein n=1 Tax=Trichinella murrelli TaxID=144512 RepID=A0A0V0T5Q5_9BILA|nr:hypothetical protein T05_7464 [Trichinella murrelli]
MRFTTLGRWWIVGGRVFHSDYAVEMWGSVNSECGLQVWGGHTAIRDGNVVTNYITQKGGLRGVVKDDGQVARGKGRPNDRCKHWRWGTQHWVSDGWVVGGDSTLIMRWKCAEQIYNNELLLEWCGSYVPILLNGGKGNQCECMVDWLAVWGKADPTMMKLMKFSEDLNTSELMLEGCKSCYHLWNEWTAGKQKLMGDGRGWAGMNGIMIGVRNDNVVHNSGANPGPVWYGDMLVEGWRSSSSFCIRAGDVVGGGGYTILNEWRSSVEWVYNYVRLWRVAGLFAQLRDILYIRS